MTKVSTNKVSISIQYAGLELPILKNEQGDDVTPLKPISDLFGLQWERQRKKVSDDSFFRDYLGTCTVLKYGADTQNRTQTCIKLDRVAAYLMALSAERIKSNGNISGADYLTSKLNEWADALHDYEQLGVAINLNHHKNQEMLLKQRRNLMALIGTKNKTAALPDRRLLTKLIKVEADALGINYQADLVDGAE